MSPPPAHPPQKVNKRNETHVGIAAFVRTGTGERDIFVASFMYDEAADCKERQINQYEQNEFKVSTVQHDSVLGTEMRKGVAYGSSRSFKASFKRQQQCNTRDIHCQPLTENLTIHQSNRWLLLQSYGGLAVSRLRGRTTRNGLTTFET